MYELVYVRRSYPLSYVPVCRAHRIPPQTSIYVFLRFIVCTLSPSPLWRPKIWRHWIGDFRVSSPHQTLDRKTPQHLGLPKALLTARNTSVANAPERLALRVDSPDITALNIFLLTNSSVHTKGVSSDFARRSHAETIIGTPTPSPVETHTVADILQAVLYLRNTKPNTLVKTGIFKREPVHTLAAAKSFQIKRHSSSITTACIRCLYTVRIRNIRISARFVLRNMLRSDIWQDINEEIIRRMKGCRWNKKQIKRR